MNKFIAYTDGSFQQSLQNGEGAGGWASVICDEYNNIIATLYYGYKHTSNNRMEAMAVLETLKYFKDPSEIIIVSDSMYVVNTIQNNWAAKWFEEKDYSKANLDIWFQILELLDFHKVTMKWVKGHSNNKMNNLADQLCTFVARCINLPEDEYYIKGKEGWEPLVS